MPLVKVMINGRAYTLGCDEGEAEHLKDLAGLVDTKAQLGDVQIRLNDTGLASRVVGMEVEVKISP